MPEGGGSQRRDDDGQPYSSGPADETAALDVFNASLYVAAHRPEDKPLAEWQRKFLSDCEVIQVKNGKAILETDDFPRNVLLAAVNGSGKTELIGELLFYWLETIPGCVIPITSSVYRQLEMLESYVKANIHKHPGFTCVEGKLTHTASGNFARWFATDTVGAVESFHAPFLIRVLDEVKSMDDEIVDATNRWQPKLSVWVSSKGLAQGRFYEAETMHRDMWRVHEVNAYDCPWIPARWIAQQIKEHGKDSSLVKSMIDNLFNSDTFKSIISMEAWDRCIKHPSVWFNDITVAGIDLSAAKRDGDECIVQIRQGNKYLEPIAIVGCSSEMEVVGECLRILRTHHVRYVFADVGGLGGPMVSRMAEVLGDDSGIELVRIDFGGSPLFDHPLLKMKDRGTEMHYDFASEVENRRLILPACLKLRAQAIAREAETFSDGTKKMVSKKKLTKSPDRLDAIVLCSNNPTATFQTKRGFNYTQTDEPSFGSKEQHKFSYSADGKFDLGN